MTNFNELFVYKIVDSQLQSTVVILVLKEKTGDRYLPVVIGESESRAIFFALEKISVPRPLTHDLFVDFMLTVKCSLENILIYRFFESIYYAHLNFLNETGEHFFVDARTSDAIAIALKCNAPIYCSEEVLTMAGISDSQLQGKATDEKIITDSQNEFSNFFDFGIEELEKLLQEAINDENYERASLIRDEMIKRKKE